jgi:hypothetical protein
MSIEISACRRQVYALPLFVAIFFILGACNGKNSDTSFVPPPTPPLSRPVIGYGVINVSYTHVVDEPGEGTQSPGYLRRGSLVHILERRLVKGEGTAEFWVLAEGNSPQGPYQGWLRESVVDIYGNEFQANTAAGSMTQ